MAALLMYAVQKTQLEIITHNFLESGHSYMECDIMHSAIETEKKYIDVYTIIDWMSIFRRARCQHPYTVVNLHHENMFDLQSLAQKIIKNRRQDEHGNIVNWLLVKCFRYEKAQPGIIQYRYNYSDDFKQINVCGCGRAVLPSELGQAYQNQIPISEAKMKNLVKLCTQQMIPAEMHTWYKSLPSTSRTKDHLPEPAVIDSGDDDDDSV